MNLSSWNLNGIGKSLPRIAKHRNASADSARQDASKEAALFPTKTDAMSATASRGLAIRRPLATKASAEWFVHEMQSRELTGERTWRALWEFYLWLCEEEELIPLPETMQARFAQELNKLCQRGQVRVREGEKLRRLTTYAIPDLKPAYLRTAA